MSASEKSDKNWMTFEEEEINPVTSNKEIHPLELYQRRHLNKGGEV